MSSIFGSISVETPKFTLLKKAATYEIRRYAPHVKAETTRVGQDISSGNMFRTLAGYIFGKNHVRNGTQVEKIAMTAPVMTEKIAMTAPVMTEKIAMTAPVMTEKESSSDAVKMSFVMPSKYTSVADLPLPDDPAVQLIQVPEQTFAVLTFSGGSIDVETKSAELLDLIKDDSDVQVVKDAKPTLARYNPPWTLPFLRTNEIFLPVTWSGSEPVPTEE